MKQALLIISLLALAGCKLPFSGPKFKVGDCFAMEMDIKERWEDGPRYIQKVLEVGRKKYRTMYVKPDHMDGYRSDEYIRSTDNIHEKIECPKQKMLKDY